MHAKNFEQNSTDKTCKIETTNTIKTTFTATKGEKIKTRVLQLQQQNDHRPNNNNKSQLFPLSKLLRCVTNTTAVAAAETTNDAKLNKKLNIKISFISCLYYQLLSQFPMKSNCNCFNFKSTGFCAASFHFGRLLTILIAILMLMSYCVSSANGAPQSCTLCDNNDLKAKDPQSSTYEEFLFEHQVTRNDAINALKALNESFFQDNSCKAFECTKKIMKYCTGPQFINDHCWCEFGHITEGLPFVPHICYLGEKIYKTAVGSCFFYEQVKECCCASVLAKQWRHISGTSSIYKQLTNFMLCSLLLCLILINKI